LKKKKNSKIQKYGTFNKKMSYLPGIGSLYKQKENEGKMEGIIRRKIIK